MDCRCIFHLLLGVFVSVVSLLMCLLLMVFISVVAAAALLLCLPPLFFDLGRHHPMLGCLLRLLAMQPLVLLPLALILLTYQGDDPSFGPGNFGC